MNAPVDFDDYDDTFRAIIKVMRYGELAGFKFFSPVSQITQQDKENLDFYRKSRWKKR